MIDIFAIKPNEVSRDPRGYSMLIYGGPKVGKTTFATRADKHLLLAFEKGYSTLPNVMAVPINNWAEFRQVLIQLESDRRRVDVARAKGEEASPMFETVVIDIVDIAWDYCEKFICAREGVSNIADIGFGKGYKMVADEFDEKLRQIARLNYGLVMISHAAYAVNPNDETIKIAAPTLAKRARAIVTRLVDIYGYVTADDTGEGVEHLIHLRETPYWEAGSRFKYMSDTIPLNYSALVKEIIKSVDKEATETNTVPTEVLINRYTSGNEILFEEVRANIQGKIRLILDGLTDADAKAKKTAEITEIIERNLGGPGRKVGDTTEKNIEQLQVIDAELGGLVE